jgi:hypothetical protein
MTPSVIKPATFRLVVQYLDHQLRQHVPLHIFVWLSKIKLVFPLFSVCEKNTKTSATTNNVLKIPRLEALTAVLM